MFDAARAGLYNLLTIYEVLSGESRSAIEARFSGKGYGDLKRDLADVVIASLEPIQTRARDLLASGELERILAQGAARAGAVADQTLRQVKNAMGFIVP